MRRCFPVSAAKNRERKTTESQSSDIPSAAASSNVVVVTDDDDDKDDNDDAFKDNDDEEENEEEEDEDEEEKNQPCKTRRIFERLSRLPKLAAKESEETIRAEEDGREPDEDDGIKVRIGATMAIDDVKSDE